MTYGEGNYTYIVGPNYSLAGFIESQNDRWIKLTEGKLVFESGSFENASRGVFLDQGLWPNPIWANKHSVCNILETLVPFDSSKIQRFQNIEEHWVGKSLFIIGLNYNVSGVLERIEDSTLIFQPGAKIVQESGTFERAVKGDFEKAEIWPGIIKVPLEALFSVLEMV